MGVGRILLRGKYFTGPTKTACVASPKEPGGQCARRLEAGRGGSGQEVARAWPPVPASCLGHWPWSSFFMKWGNFGGLT